MFKKNLQIRAMFDYSKLATMSLQALRLGVVSDPASDRAVSSSLRWKIRCTSRSKGSVGDESLLNRCRRAARSSLASTLSKSALTLRATKPVGTVPKHLSEK